MRPGTINSSVLNLSQRFMKSAFAAQVLDPHLMAFAASGRDRYGNVANRNRAKQAVLDYKHEVAAFTSLFQHIAPHLPVEYAPNDDPEWLTWVQAKVFARAEDLSFLRGVLCVLSVDEDEKRQLTPDLWARFLWDVYHGGSVAMVLTSSSPEPSIERITKHQLAFRRDGWLCHREYPWLRVQSDYLPDARRMELAVSWYLLDTLTSPLYEAWVRLDRGPEVIRGLAPDATDEEQTASLAIALVESDAAGAEAPVANRPRPPRLRLKRIQAILTKHFGCEWSNAKGSEQKVYRHGGKHFTFGCHGVDRAVRPAQLKSCLKKLGIPLPDFITACC